MHVELRDFNKPVPITNRSSSPKRTMHQEKVNWDNAQMCRFILSSSRNCNPTVIQSQVPKAAIKGFLNVCRIMPCLGTIVVVFQFTGTNNQAGSLKLTA